MTSKPSTTDKTGKTDQQVDTTSSSPQPALDDALTRCHHCKKPFSRGEWTILFRPGSSLPICVECYKKWTMMSDLQQYRYCRSCFICSPQAHDNELADLLVLAGLSQRRLPRAYESQVPVIRHELEQFSHHLRMALDDISSSCSSEMLEALLLRWDDSNIECTIKRYYDDARSAVFDSELPQSAALKVFRERLTVFTTDNICATTGFRSMCHDILFMIFWGAVYKLDEVHESMTSVKEPARIYVKLREAVYCRGVRQTQNLRRLDEDTRRQLASPVAPSWTTILEQLTLSEYSDNQR